MMAFWEKQLNSMTESGRLDRDTLDDLAVVYAAETGDGSLFGAVMSPAPIYTARLTNYIREAHGGHIWRMGSRSAGSRLRGHQEYTSRSCAGSFSVAIAESRSTSRTVVTLGSFSGGSAERTRCGSCSRGRRGQERRSVSCARW